MADTITLRTSTWRDVIKIVERGPQGPAGGGGGGGSGTVTSVALAGTGLSITGSPVTASGTITANVSYGTTAGTACQGNDSRLSDARTPTAHTHVAADITDLQTNGNAAGLWDSVNDEQLVSTGDGELQIRKTGTALSGAVNASFLSANRGYNLPDASGTLALTTTVVNNAAGLWDSANSVTGATVADYELSVTNGANTSSLTFPVGASRNYTLPNAAGTLALTSDITKTAVGLGNVPNVDTTNAANISSGVLDNARVNFAAPPAIGSTTSNTGAFTTLSASTSLTLGTSGILSGGTNTIEQRNTTSAQTFRIYNTVSGTNDANFERLRIAWASNVAIIGTEKAGTGGARALEFQTDGATRFTLAAANTATFAGGLALQWGGGGTRIIGATFPSNLLQLQTASTDRLVINDTLVAFGSATNAFPALKRSSTTLQVRLADDSADAPLSAANITLGAGTATVPSLSLSGSSVGIYQRAVGELSFTDGSECQVRYFSNNIVVNSDFAIGWGNSTVAPTGLDTILRRDAAGIIAQYNGVNAQAYRLYNTFTSINNFERLNIRWSSNECIIDTEIGGSGGTLRGIKIGSATSSLLGFYGATPVDRPATVADPAGGGTVDTEARTAINDIIDRLQELGLIA